MRKSQSKQFQVLLADDHELVRRGLRALVESVPGWKVCGMAETGIQAVQEAHRLRPDIVVADMDMPGLDGLEVTRRIKRNLPECEILIFTGVNESDELIREVYSSGAKGFISKNEAAQFLIDALRNLSEHKPFFTEKASSVIFARFTHPQPSPSQGESAGDERLTPAERNLIGLLSQGHTNATVAKKQRVSVRTVENLRADIMRKLKLTSFADLVRYAVRNEIIKL